MRWAWLLPWTFSWLACASSSNDHTDNAGHSSSGGGESGSSSGGGESGSSSGGGESGSSSGGGESGSSSGGGESGSSSGGGESGSSSGGGESGSSSGGGESGSSSGGSDEPLEIPADCVSELTIDSRPGASKSEVFEQCRHTLPRSATPLANEFSGQCRFDDGDLPAVYYKLIELKNPTQRNARVEIRLDAERSGWSAVQLMAYRERPQRRSDLNACLSGVNTQCANPVGLSDPRWPCLIEDAAIDVPAQGSAWVYVPQHHAANLSAGSIPVRFLLMATVPQF